MYIEYATSLVSYGLSLIREKINITYCMRHIFLRIEKYAYTRDISYI